MLDKKDAIRTILKPKDGKHRPTYTFICTYIGCSNEIIARADYLSKHSGFCRVHSMIKKPFESIYNTLMRNKGLNNSLTYEEFLFLLKSIIVIIV